MDRRVAFLAFAAVVVAAVVATSTSSASPDRSTDAAKGGTKKHAVDMTWKPDNQDFNPGPVVFDDFDSFGPPFGDDAVVETKTPRKQIGTDERHGKWSVTLKPGKGPDKCSGSFDVELNYIETTPTSQTIEYGGTVTLKSCKGSKTFRNVVPGKLGNLHGEITCRERSCRGGLNIDGSLRY